MKDCKYNNCNNIISDSKYSNSKFCCRNCKQKYRRQQLNISKKLNNPTDLKLLK